jgi:xanthine/uracil/vitamin C permease (AzgA family)
MNEILEFLAARPVILVPVLLLAAMFVFAVLKRLLKVAAIVAIAGVLYVVLAEYLGLGVAI